MAKYCLDKLHPKKVSYFDYQIEDYFCERAAVKKNRSFMPARGRGYYFSGGESCSQNTQVLFSKNISERFSESNIKQ